MPMPTQEQLDRARRQAEQAKARYQALQARFGEAARKRDTRRKIILGGLLLDAAAKDERFARVLATLLQRIDRDHDRQAFADWTPPAPGAGRPARTGDEEAAPSAAAEGPPAP
jgi:hypothetical protein